MRGIFPDSLEDNRVMVTDTNCYPYYWMLYLLATCDGTNYYRGSGFLFHHSLIVTCGHCAYPRINGNDKPGLFPKKIEVYRNNNGIMQYLCEVEGTVVVSTRYANNTLDWADDWGLLTLKNKLPYGGIGLISTDYFNTIKNEDAAVTGFPSDTHAEKNSQSLWTGNGSIDGMTDDGFYTYKVSIYGSNGIAVPHYTRDGRTITILKN